MATEQSYKRLIKLLKKDWPLSKPVLIRRIKMSHDSTIGECDVHSDKFYIKLNKNKSIEAQKDTLIHEWAHALVWHPNERSYHREEWANMYAKLIRWSQEEDEWDYCTVP